MDTNILEIIEDEINDLVNEYTAPEVIDSVNKLKNKINEYRINPSEKIKFEILILLDKFI